MAGAHHPFHTHPIIAVLDGGAAVVILPPREPGLVLVVHRIECRIMIICLVEPHGQPVGMVVEVEGSAPHDDEIEVQACKPPTDCSC